MFSRFFFVLELGGRILHCVECTFYNIILTTSAVSSTNLGSIRLLIAQGRVVGARISGDGQASSGWSVGQGCACQGISFI